MPEPAPAKPDGTKPMTSQQGAHGGGNKFFQMAVKDAFEIQKRNQQANITQKASVPRQS